MTIRIFITLCRNALKVEARRRSRYFLDSRELTVMYMAQKRPHLEYTPPLLMPAVPSHARKLDNILQRAFHLMHTATPPPHLRGGRSDVGAISPPLGSSYARFTPTAMLRYARVFSPRVARLQRVNTTATDTTKVLGQQVKEATQRWRVSATSLSPQMRNCIHLHKLISK